jgi:hypothetical protein
MKTELKPGTKVFLISGMKKKPAYIDQVCTTYAIDGRWYWSDGKAVDGSAMRWEERK